MIKIRDCEILNLLPYTFKTPRRQALSKALVKVRARCYDIMSSVLFWGDIENANNALLDAMAAELDCAFYSSDMSAEQKRSIIAANFEYNSKVGTVSSIMVLLAVAFGAGEFKEWFEYGGEPYHFKVVVRSKPPLCVTESGYGLFFKNIEKIKPVRTKMEDVRFTRSTDLNIYAGGAVVKRFKKIIVKAG